MEGAGAQTRIKETDKAFIMLERFQRDAGTGRGAGSGGNAAAARVDWLKRLMWAEERGGAWLRMEERNETLRLYNATSRCQERLRYM